MLIWQLCCTWCVCGGCAVTCNSARQEKVWESDMRRERVRRGCLMRDERGFVWLHNLQRAQASHLLLYDQQASPLLTAAGFNPLIHNLFVLSSLFLLSGPYVSLCPHIYLSILALVFQPFLYRPCLKSVFQSLSPSCLVLLFLSGLLSCVM